MTEADADPSFEGWAYISKQGRRWRVPTGPGYPAHPSVHNGHLAAPEVYLVYSDPFILPGYQDIANVA